MANKKIEKMLQGLNILVVNDNAYMRSAYDAHQSQREIGARGSGWARGTFKPRPMVKVGTFNVPQPRRTAAPRETTHAG